jgi:hypothetical protein
MPDLPGSYGQSDLKVQISQNKRNYLPGYRGLITAMKLPIKLIAPSLSVVSKETIKEWQYVFPCDLMQFYVLASGCLFRLKHRRAESAILKFMMFSSKFHQFPKASLVKLGATP